MNDINFKIASKLTSENIDTYILRTKLPTEVMENFNKHLTAYSAFDETKYDVSIEPEIQITVKRKLKHNYGRTDTNA